MRLAFELSEDQMAALADRVAELLRDESPTRATPADEKEMLPVADAAELADLSPKTIHNYLSDGRLTRYGQPGVPRVSRAELLSLMTAGRSKGRW